MKRRLADDRGQSLGPELLIIIGLAVLCWGFLAWLGRLTSSSQDLANTAQAAARAASMQPDPERAGQAAAEAVAASNLSGACSSVSMDPLSWSPGPQGTWRGGTVTITVRCEVADREAVGFSGRSIAASDTQVIDRYAVSS